MIEVLSKIELRDWITIAAILLGPVLAVIAADRIRIRSEVRERRIKIFRTLLTTRGQPFSLTRVEAINLVGIEFSPDIRKERATFFAWRDYAKHLDHEMDPTTQSDWEKEESNLLDNLLLQMSSQLGYELSKSHLEEASYYPIHARFSDELNFNMRGLVVEILEGRRSVNITLNRNSSNSKNDNSTT